MSTHKAGLGFEDRLISFLSRQGFDIGHHPTLDHEYKLDFVIRKFPSNPKFHSMGVQVTTRPGEIQKMREFAEVHSSDYRVVDKVIYVEVDPRLDFERGVGHLISTGISDFQFNTRHNIEKISGLKINADMSYSLFDIEETVIALASREVESRKTTSAAVPATFSEPKVPIKVPPHAPTVVGHETAKLIENGMRGVQKQPSKPKLQGFINAYYRTRDHGFITAQNGEPYFFSLMGVADGQLRDQLLALPQIDWGASIDGTVEFEDAGKTRPNARYPEAKVVRIAK